ncbi:hypothetical protein [Tautonia plasticadhaerens]|uniref:Uncharacterized protein n=1 Tax=Tautonia plasticadhaerens TaxID=2527974 RepID=A0A518GXZ0_9BACT|nr:hypothetical protein [Tautonia plasticadhaerens]QDV33412.1 hypothetical protein ElP_12830 [Tautonia plasticadhaerens]
MIDRIAVAAGAAILSAALVGCGGRESENRSTLATEDPAAYEQAKGEAEQAEQRNRAAEAEAVGDAFEGIEGP